MNYAFTRTGPEIEAIHNTVIDLPNRISNENLILNSDFSTPGSVTNPPDATPRSYNAGDELFSGIFAVGALSNVTYVNGVLNGPGQLYTDVFKTEKQKDSTAQYVASISESNGLSIESGASFIDNGDYWRVTFDMVNTFSVKLEQGSNATIHEINQLTFEVIDLIVGIGQSNAQGIGDIYRSPDCPKGLSDTLDRLQDPVGPANNGSMWPSFVSEHYNQTGRRSMCLNKASFGSALIADSNPSNNWSPTGSLRGAALASVNSAINNINNSIEYKLGDIHFVWLQGESESQSLNGTTITPEIYKTSLIELKDYFKSSTPKFTKFGLVMIGGTRGSGRAALNVNTSDLLGFEKIKLAQKQVTDIDSEISLLYFGPASFGPRYLMVDNIHYDQVGLNETGKCAAIGLANTQPTGNISPFLGSDSATAPTNSGETSLSLNRDVSVFANTLIVCVTVGVYNSNSSASISADVNGVPMREVAKGYDNATGRTSVSMFVINESDLGFGLSGRNVDINVNTTPANFLSFSVIDARDISYYQSLGFDNVADGSIVSETDSQVEISTYMPSLIVGVVGAVGDGAATPTCLFTGLNLEQSTGNTNGIRTASSFTGVSEENLLLESSVIGSSISDPQTNIVFLTASFRPIIKGETDNRYNT